MRQLGFYWCKYNGEWTVAEYWQISNCCGWSMMEEENILFTDSDFEEIDERRIERDPTVADRINEIDEAWTDLCLRMQKDIDKNPEWT